MKLSEVIEGMKGKRVLVLGDLTLDKFSVGKVTRISPEAPVPVVDLESESYYLGGAANAINNLISLSADVAVTTVVGDDPEGDYLVQEIKKRGIKPNGIFKDKGRITTVVSRIRAGDYQLLRLERSKDVEIGSKLTDEIVNYVSEVAKFMDIFVIFDYGRGVVTRPLMGQIVKIAKKQDITTVVNPKKENFWSYEGVDVIRANKREASHATGVTLINETSIRNMGLKILASLLCRAALITWIEEGFYLFEQKEKVTFIPPLIGRAVDVTGVGDTITCALALSLAAGATFEEASKVANYAGAIAANQRGLATVSLEELKNAISKGRINGG